MDYPQDPRTVAMLGRFGPSGEPLPVTRQDMVDEAARRSVSAHTPEPVAEQLRVARELFIHCLLVWEFGTVGVAWSLMAVESHLRCALHVGRSPSFQELVRRARTGGLITEDLAEALDAGRQLRNMFSHPQNQPVWTLGMTGESIRMSHIVVDYVSEAWARRPDKRQDGGGQSW